MISFTDMYRKTGIEGKKMIAAVLIKRVEVYRDYRFRITFAISIRQFVDGLNVEIGE